MIEIMHHTIIGSLLQILGSILWLIHAVLIEYVRWRCLDKFFSYLVGHVKSDPSKINSFIIHILPNIAYICVEKIIRRITI